MKGNQEGKRETRTERKSTGKIVKKVKIQKRWGRDEEGQERGGLEDEGREEKDNKEKREKRKEDYRRA